MKLFLDKLQNLALNSSSTKQIALRDVPFKDRLRYINDEGYDIDPYHVYEVLKRISLRNEYGNPIRARELDMEILKALAKSCDKKYDNLLADKVFNNYIEGKYEDDEYVSITVSVLGKDMTDKQKLDELTRTYDISLDTKVTEENFGGANVVRTLKAVREMSDEEFNSWIAGGSLK